MEDIDILYEKLTYLLESQRCFLSVVNKETIIRGPHWDEAYKSAWEINESIAKVFGLTPRDEMKLETVAMKDMAEVNEIKRMLDLTSPH